MKSLIFKVLYSLLWLVTRLPIEVLYGFSFLIFPFVYYIFPYRKKIVFRNLEKSFPKWDKRKIRKTARSFYFHFCISMIESLYTGVLSPAAFRKRYHVKNPEIINQFYRQGKSVSLMMAHYANWEWSVSLQLHVNHQTLPIYKPLHNSYIDKKVKADRSRFGMRPVPMEKILRTLYEYQAKNIPTLTYFIADQRPLMAKIQHWTSFLNQDTPVVMGPEKIARKFDHAVLFLKITPKKLGHYELEFIPMFENANQAGEYQIIEKYHKLLEEIIREKPEYWLWTHNRWKHKKENYYKLRKNRNK